MRIHHIIPAIVLSLGFAMAPTTVRAADSYTVDPVHTAALFKIKHVGVSYTYGRFNDVSGTVTIDAANPAASKVEIAIQAGSVDTHSEKRDAHLASPDFFDAKQYATFGFVSSAFKKVDDATYEVAGNFTLHGVTKPLTITVKKVGEGKDPWGGYRIGFESTFTIKHSNFGMTKMLEAINDEIAMTFSTEAIKK
ncbi:MAG TPA: YceI family protein [Planctomycetota bacterium]|nr:YceI family protein [Planctomycetota bacterium]